MDPVISLSMIRTNMFSYDCVSCYSNEFPLPVHEQYECLSFQHLILVFSLFSIKLCACVRHWVKDKLLKLQMHHDTVSCIIDTVAPLFQHCLSIPSTLNCSCACIAECKFDWLHLQTCCCLCFCYKAPISILLTSSHSSRLFMNLQAFCMLSYLYIPRIWVVFLKCSFGSCF